MKKLLLVDGNSLLYRAYYAFSGTGVTLSHDGTPTHATYGFLNMLVRAIENIKPTHIAVCFDVRGKTFRHDQFKDYKATRKPTPEDLIVQLSDTKELLTKLEIKVVEKPGFEADDLIGTLCGLDADTVILTADRDAFQLVGQRTELDLTKTGVTTLDIWTEKRIESEYGITPKQMIDLKAISGDTSDNIPGARGIGEKGAIALIQQWGSIEDIYDNLDKIKDSVRQKLITSQDTVFLSKKLATINTSVELDIRLQDLALTFPFKVNAKQVFVDKGFKSLVNKKSIWQEEAEKKDINLEDLLKTSFKELVIDWDTEFVYVNDYRLRILVNLFDGGLPQDEIWRGLKPLLEGDVPKSISDSKALKETLLPLGIKLDNIIKDTRISNHIGTGSKGLINDIELPLVDVLIDMQNAGIALHMVQLDKMADDYKTKIDSITREIFKIAGVEFNVNSPQQLGEILFKKLGLTAIEKTKTGYSTNEDVLQKLNDKHPIIEPILRYRKLAKLYSTYIMGYKKLADNGFIYTKFNNTGTITGRLSSSEPNIQNIPDEIRKVFKSRFNGGRLLGADYSQIELRILASLSGDEVMIDAFKNGRDIHDETAKVLGCQRRMAKAVNFGIIYGMSSFGLGESLGIKPFQAQQFIEKYFAQFPKIKAFLDSCVERANIDGYIETIFGRRRYLPDLSSNNPHKIKFAHRAAMNMPMQGGAADIIKKAMITIHARIKRENLKSIMVAQIHDELVFDCTPDEVELISNLARQEMQSAHKLAVPLHVDISNW